MFPCVCEARETCEARERVSAYHSQQHSVSCCQQTSNSGNTALVWL